MYFMFCETVDIAERLSKYDKDVRLGHPRVEN